MGGFCQIWVLLTACLSNPPPVGLGATGPQTTTRRGDGDTLRHRPIPTQAHRGRSGIRAWNEVVCFYMCVCASMHAHILYKCVLLCMCFFFSCVYLYVCIQYVCFCAFICVSAHACINMCFCASGLYAHVYVLMVHECVSMCT